MNKEQYLLVKLAEECNEVAQIALKSAQFGLNNIKPEQLLTNRQRLNSELNDLLIILTFMQCHNLYEIEMESQEISLAKKAKVETFWNVARDLGMVKNA